MKPERAHRRAGACGRHTRPLGCKHRQHNRARKTPRAYHACGKTGTRSPQELRRAQPVFVPGRVLHGQGRSNCVSLEGADGVEGDCGVHKRPPSQRHVRLDADRTIAQAHCVLQGANQTMSARRAARPRRITGSGMWFVIVTAAHHVVPEVRPHAGTRHACLDCARPGRCMDAVSRQLRWCIGRCCACLLPA
jgi:hypothetical protein